MVAGKQGRHGDLHLLRRPLSFNHGAFFFAWFLFNETSLPTWFKNSFIVALNSTAISLGVGILAAYGLARLRFRGSSGFALMIFVTYLVPTSLLFLPLSTVIRLLGLANTFWALILTYPSLLIPFCTWLLLGYFKTIPLALEESAMIDGCGRFQAMVHIVLPLAVPGIACVGLFAFTLSWQEFIYSLTFISSAGQKTLPSGIVTELVRGDVYFWGSLMSACLLGSIPIAILYSLFLDYFVATKGGLIISAPSDQVRGNTNDNKLQAGVVLMAGIGYYDADNGIYEPTEIQPGAVVILPQYSAQTISKFPGINRPTANKVVLVKEDSVLAYYQSQEAFETAERLLNEQT